MTDLTVSDVLSDANAIYNEVNQIDDANDNIDNAIELAEEVSQASGGIVQEGFDSTNTKVLKIVLESLIGEDILSRYNVKLEDGMNPTQSSLVHESIKAVVKDFWNALKNSFNAIWAKLKSWYITVSSASESLIKKANKTRTKAEAMSSEPKERKFDLKSFSTIHIGGKVSNQILRKGLTDIDKLLETSLNVRSTNEVEKFIQTAEQALEDFVKSENASNPDASWVNRFSDLYTPKVGVKVNTLTDKEILAQVGVDTNNAEYKVTETLLGDHVVVFSEVKANSTAPLAEKLSLIRGTLIKTSAKDSKPQTVNVDTLYPEQIVGICDQVISINEQIAYYDKAWQRRDKFMTGVINTIDKTIEKISNSEEGDSRESVYKRTTRSILTSIKRSNTFNASLINFAVRASNEALGYADASITQYKKVV